MGLPGHALKLRLTFEAFDIHNFVETGTRKGRTVARIAQLSRKFFDNRIKIQSIEINGKFYEYSAKRFAANPDITIHYGASKNIIGPLASSLDSKPTFWWLDAHFGSIDPFPLKDELSSILKNRDTSKDIILIDDLRIYDDGTVKYSPAARWKGGKRNEVGGGVKFLREMFPESIIIESPASNGMGIIFPPKVKDQVFIQGLVR